LTIIEPVPRQLSLSVRLDDSATFDNFYIEQTASVEQVSSDLGNTHIIDVLKSVKAGDLLYLWGNKGAGCSHLLQACCHWFAQKAVYLPLEQFIDEDPAEVLAGLEQMPIVLLDDLNQVIDRHDWAEQVFHLYNRIQDNNSILVVSANSPPSSLKTPLADVKSRLSAMQVHKVETLEDEAKVSALIHRAANRGMNMPYIVAQYLLVHYSRDMGDQIQLLDQLDQVSLEEKRKLSIPLVKKVLDTNN